MKAERARHPLILRRLYRNYRGYSAMRQWFVRRFTAPGKLVLIGVVVAGCMGVDTNRAVAYQAFTFLALLMLLSMVASRFSKPRFSLRRALPRYGSVGESLAYTITLENLENRLQRSLDFVDELKDPRPTLDEFASTPEPKELERNAVDRFFKFYRWSWIIDRNLRGVVDERKVPAIPAGGRAEIKMSLHPVRRGALQLEGGTIACPDPFGLYRSMVKTVQHDKVLILPRRHALPPFDLPGSMRYQQGGVALASSVGESEEFASLRDYRPGDPIRHIHWKSWAKVGRPIVKEFQDEFFVRHALILDTFSEAAFSETFEEAVSVAASLACAIDTQDSLLDLLFVGPAAYCFTAGRGLAHSAQMLEILAAVETCPNKPFESLDHLVLQHAASVSGCICIFIAWNDERRELLRKLQGLEIPTKIFLISEAGAPRIDSAELKLSRDDSFHQLDVGAIKEGLARL